MRSDKKGMVSFAYDAAGNRTTITDGPGLVMYNYRAMYEREMNNVAISLDS